MSSPALIRPASWDDDAVSNLRVRVWKHAKKFARTNQTRLAHLTMTIAAYEVDLRDDRARIIAKASADLDRFKADLRAALKASGSIDAKLSRAGTVWIGAPECDLIDAEDYLSPAKREMLAGLGIWDDSGLYEFGAPDPHKAFVLLHAHIIVDRRGHKSDWIFDQAIRRAFPGHRRVCIQDFHADKTTKANLSALASYMTKFRWRHSQTGDDNGTGRTTFHRHFRPSWREWLKHLYLGIGLEHFVISNMAGADLNMAGASSTMAGTARNMAGANPNQDISEPSEIWLKPQGNEALQPEITAPIYSAPVPSEMEGKGAEFRANSHRDDQINLHERMARTRRNI